MKKEIDEKMAPIVAILNEKGYKTFASCEGHEKDVIPEIYVSFEGVPLEVTRTLPGKPFSNDSRCHRNGAWFGLVERTSSGKMRYSLHLGLYTLDEDEYEKLRIDEKFLDERRKELEEWAKSLPTRGGRFKRKR